MGIFFGLVALLYIAARTHTWYTSAPRESRRLLHDWKHYRIDELPENKTGCLVGVANPVGELLQAPLSGRACVYYHVKLSKRGRFPYALSLLSSEQRGVAFSLVDDSGRAIVDPANATAALVFDHKRRRFFRTTAEEELLARHKRPMMGMVFFGDYIWEEAVIEPGERVAVLGAGIREPDPDAEPEADYRGVQPTRFRLTSSTRWPLVISDDPMTLEPRER